MEPIRFDRSAHSLPPESPDLRMPTGRATSPGPETRGGELDVPTDPPAV